MLTKWEYVIDVCESDVVEAVLNSRGRAGWEAVSISTQTVHYPGDPNDRKFWTVVFKRPTIPAMMTMNDPR